MSVKQRIEEAVEDLLSLEVATLTNDAGQALPLKRTLLDNEVGREQTAYDQVEKERAAVLESIKAGKTTKEDREATRAAKKALREAKTQYSEVCDALGIYDPKEIFKEIRSNLNEGVLVAYSRFEFEGDSVNFVNNDESVSSLVSEHQNMVAASQESRKALFESAIKLLKSGL